jgi:hypothetical protein
MIRAFIGDLHVVDRASNARTGTGVEAGSSLYSVKNHVSQRT